MKLKKELDGICLNCSANLQSDDQFCPRCGQKVDRNDLSLRGVLKEFFENYVSLDSRFGRTLLPFLFKPGFLSNEFIQGVRVSYANPFRLYIFTSLFFFFALNANVNKNKNKKQDMPSGTSEIELRPFEDLNGIELKSFESKLSESQIKLLNQSDDKKFKTALLSQKPINIKKILPLLNDTLTDQLSLNKDSLLAANSSGVSWNTNDSDFDIDFDLQPIRPYLNDPTYSDQMLYDTLSMGQEVSKWQEILAKRMIKVERADEGEVGRYILSNLSLAMFVLVPLFAFFLKLLYWRRNRYYVAHLIHTVYLQSFAFLIFGLAMLLRWLDLISKDVLFDLFKVLVLIFAVYFIASFRRIYKQSWFKLIIKSFTLFFTYAVLGLIVIAVEILISFLLF